MFDRAQDPSFLKKKHLNIQSEHRLLKCKRPYTEKLKKSLAYQGPKRWNALSEQLHHAPNKNVYRLKVSNLVKGKSAADNLGACELDQTIV